MVDITHDVPPKSARTSKSSLLDHSDDALQSAMPGPALITWNHSAEPHIKLLREVCTPRLIFCMYDMRSCDSCYAARTKLSTQPHTSYARLFNARPDA